MAAKRYAGRMLAYHDVPDDWAVDHGYAERYTYHAARKVDGKYVDEERVRYLPGANREHALVEFHGGNPKACRYGDDAAQWAYPAGAGKTVAERLATVAALTGLVDLHEQLALAA